MLALFQTELWVRARLISAEKHSLFVYQRSQSFRSEVRLTGGGLIRGTKNRVICHHIEIMD